MVQFVAPTQPAATKAVPLRIVDHKAKQHVKPAASGRALSVMFHGPADAVQQATQQLRKDRNRCLLRKDRNRCFILGM